MARVPRPQPDRAAAWQPGRPQGRPNRACSRATCAAASVNNLLAAHEPTRPRIQNSSAAAAIPERMEATWSWPTLAIGVVYAATLTLSVTSTKPPSTDSVARETGRGRSAVRSPSKSSHVGARSPPVNRAARRLSSLRRPQIQRTCRTSFYHTRDRIGHSAAETRWKTLRGPGTTESRAEPES